MKHLLTQSITNLWCKTKNRFINTQTVRSSDQTPTIVVEINNQQSDPPPRIQKPLCLIRPNPRKELQPLPPSIKLHVVVEIWMVSDGWVFLTHHLDMF